MNHWLFKSEPATFSIDDLGKQPKKTTATAIAPELISTSTPVAYAPPCATTLALKMIVTRMVMAEMITTIGRVARAHSGAMP